MTTDTKALRAMLAAAAPQPIGAMAIALAADHPLARLTGNSGDAFVFSSPTKGTADATRALMAALPALLDELDEARATLANERGNGEPPIPGWSYRDPTPHACRVAECRDWRTWCHDSGMYLSMREDGTGYRLARPFADPARVGGFIAGPVYKYAREAMRAAKESE